MSEELKFDFDSNIKYLLENNLSNSVENGIVEQDKIMSSKDFNTTFKYIEDSLNFLYEKNRVLEDVIKYSNLFLKNEMNNAISECKTLLSAIEDDRDLTKNNSYIKYSVPFTSGSTSHIDRDNSVISKTTLYDGKLIQSSTVMNSFSAAKASVELEYKTYNVSNSIDDLINDNTYRSFYMFNRHQGKAITETITLTLENPTKLNKINLNVSNCLIKEIKLVLEDNSELIIDEKTGIFKPNFVKQILVTVTAAQYIVSQINYNEFIKTNSDFWSAIDAIKADENLIVDKQKYYYYLFGIDNVKLEYVLIDNNSGFISKDIKIELKNNEYITLEASDSIERGSIEYYIIDGTKTIPILPEDTTEIIDEKIFYKSSTRFVYDASKPITIKKNGAVVKMTLQDAININDPNSLYTVSYTPIISNISELNDTSIKVKAIIRNYDKNFNSFINKINIKKYGGGKLWIDRI